MDTSKLALLADLSDSAISAFEAELVAEFTQKRTEELTVSGVAELSEISAAVTQVREARSARSAAVAAPATPSAEELAEAADAAAAAIETSVSDEAEVEAEVVEPAVEEDAPAAELAASESVELAISPAGLESDLDAVTAAPAAITAGADIPGYTAGTSLNDFNGVARAFMARRGTLKGVDSAGDGDEIIVASIEAAYPAERQLSADNAAENMAKIQAVASPEAVTASGGLCAPLEPYYGIQVISAAHRPVRDALPKFAADRGGVRFQPPPKLSSLTSAIGVYTATQDALTYNSDGSGGGIIFKPCLHVTCGVEQSVTVEAITRCLTFGNFGARTYPEQVEAWLALAIAAHARRAEGLLLDAIDVASTQVTAAANYSAVRSLLSQVDQAVAAYRSRNRTAPGMSLRIMLPDWSKELIRADLARGFRGGDLDPLSVSDAQIVSWFTERSVTPTFYADTATGAGQVFAAQGAGALTAFPTTVVWYLFVEGSFVFLDGGTLDLGLVRDSTLNKTNDYQIFAETFEAVAFYGVESIKVSSTVCANGSYAPAATGQSPCTV
jgi:hypothetical protein